MTHCKLAFSIIMLMHIIFSYHTFANDECPLCKSKWCCQCVLGKIIKNIESAFDEYSGQEHTPDNLHQSYADNAPIFSQVTADIDSRPAMHMDMDMVVSFTLNVKHKNNDLEAKKGLFDDKVSRIKRWKNLEAMASSKKEGSSEWYQSWQQAYQYASSMLPYDYHFNLNAAIALTRLGELQSAVVILKQQLEQKIADLQYRSGLLRQLGFVYYYAKEFECSLSCYQQALPPGTHISTALHNIIDTIIVNIEQSGCYKKDALDWFNSLRTY